MRKLYQISSIIVAIVIVGLTFLTHNTANAQPTIGIKGGASLANIHDSNGNSLDSKAGILFGAFTSFDLASAPVIIKPELLYTSKGAQATGVSLFSGTSGTSADFTYKFNYIEIAGMVQYPIESGSSFAPYVEAGPYLSFNTKADVKVESGGNSASVDVSDQVSGTDVGLSGGAGINVSGFNIGARYDLGLTKAVENGDIKNSAFFITAGYSF